MIRRRLLVLLSVACLYSYPDLRAEDFVAKHGSYEINGKKNKISDVRVFPSFDAEYQQGQDVVTIKSSAGSMILKKGNFFYSYRGVHKGLTITTTAYVTDGKISHIVYEEWDKANNIKATINYYKK